MGKKKNKALKVTNNEKKMATSLEGACQSFRSKSIQEEYKRFLDHLTLWLHGHQQQAEEVFSYYDTDRSGTISMENLELGIKDLGIPCLQFQLYMLAQLLKTGNNGEIHYRDMNNQLQRARLEGTRRRDEKGEDADQIRTLISEQKEEGEGERVEDDMRQGSWGEDGPCCLEITREKLKPCPRCQLGLWSPAHPETKRFILLSLRLIPFDYGGPHPGNFEVVVPSSTRVWGLTRVIKEQVGIQSSRLQVFRTRVPSQESFLPPESSLRECGFTGGPEDSPHQVTLFYEYRLEFTDCPILNCDHYFS